MAPLDQVTPSEVEALEAEVVRLQEENSALKEANQTLEETERALVPFFNLSLDLLCIAGTDGYFKRINKGFERVLGFTKEELLGEPFLHFIHPDDREATLAEVARLKAGLPTTYFENRYQKKSGGWVWLAWTSETDPATGLLYAAARDITHQRSVEEALVRSNDELEQFAYIASHDLQEPLRTITSFVNLLEEDYRDVLDNEGHTYLNFIVEGAERSKALIQDLLTYSRAGRQELNLQPVDIDGLVVQIQIGMRALILETNAEITVDPLPTLYVDETQMTLLFQNVLSNAIKYHKKGVPPKVHVRVEQVEAGWHFSIEDQGIGIKERYLERIFEAFKRLHSRIDYPGTGVGLAICKRVVERHGGQLWVTSTYGEGSTFHFTIADPPKP